MTSTPARTFAGRLLWHPLLWAALSFAGALPLLGTEHDFWGFLLSLIAGWALAHAVVRGLFAVRSPWLAVGVHLAVSAAAGAALFAVAQPGLWPLAVPSAVRAAISFATITFSGWIWLALIGRAAAAVQASADRRAAQLVEPEWHRDGDAWTLRLPVVPLRRSSYLAIVTVLGASAAAAMTAFVLVFADLAERMGPMAMLLLLGWTVGMPVFLVLRAIARARTVTVDVRLGVGGVRVCRTDGRTLLDVPFGGIRSLFVSFRNAPTRIVVRPVEGPGLVLLVGLARRPRGAAATVPELSRRVTRALADAGLESAPGRRVRAGEVTLTRV